MKLKSLFYLIGIFLLIACEQPNDRVYWIEYGFQGKPQDSVLLEIRKEGFLYNYGVEDSTGTFNSIITMTFNPNDLTLSLWSVHNCILFDSLTQLPTNEPTIYKFFYDEPETVDEELLVYVNAKHGILGTKSHSWGIQTLMFNENAQELSSYILTDTMGFQRMNLYW